MSDDSRLQAVWALDEPPARDAAFEFAVMERLLRRRVWMDIAALGPIVVGAAIALWALTPLLVSAAQLAASDTDVLVGLIVSLGIALIVFVVDMLRPDSA